ncbi:hypothetical protein NDU88_001084 [Pleurodeles waltl]|uniref:Uncharacterized protein n=1 Tax=Pleurodeles waltl TaxID=8319 RepID=A0AAV7SBJ7_PLEWA|nr:hypothetical protein NDU88_001084 [Pleurodeles waltl]
MGHRYRSYWIGRAHGSFRSVGPPHGLQAVAALQRIHRQVQAHQSHPRPEEPSESSLPSSPVRPEPGHTSLLSAPATGLVGVPLYSSAIGSPFAASVLRRPLGRRIRVANYHTAQADHSYGSTSLFRRPSGGKTHSAVSSMRSWADFR